MRLVFFDNPVARDNLKPFTLTRPIADIRTGILKISEKWSRHLLQEAGQTAYLTEPYLQNKYPLHMSEVSLFVNASVLPDEELQKAVAQLPLNYILKQGDILIAAHLSSEKLKALQAQASLADAYQLLMQLAELAKVQEYAAGFSMITQVWHIFLQNGNQITADFKLLTAHRESAQIEDPHTIIYGDKKDIFIEEGVSVRASILNAETGPIYLGKNATIHENAVIKGPFAMLEGSHINIGSKIREGTTLGPFSKLGGEVKNIVVFGNSNKGHEGFLGNSVIGEWCNFGADTNTSNLKNNYKPVRLWNYGTLAYEDTGEQFCGLMMGDHSKCGINTMFNTGTVVGVSANIFGSGYPDKFIPSFSWGGAEECTVYRLDKALEVAQHVLHRRGIQLSQADEDILRHIHENRSTETEK